MEDYGQEYFQKVYDTSGEGRVITNQRFKLLLRAKPRIKRILDIGCSYGDFLELAEKKGMQTSGLDISEYALKKARKRVKGKLDIVDVERERLPFNNDSFDAVVVFDVIEHLKSSDFLFSEIFRVLVPKGLLFVTTPNHQGWFREFATRIFPDDPTHVNVNNGLYWERHLQKSGLSKIEIRGVVLHGIPPLPVLRRLFERLSIPTYLGPVFFPMKAFCGYLYITAWKRR
jgi:SAM-dependent methyltransferase